MFIVEQNYHLLLLVFIEHFNIYDRILRYKKVIAECDYKFDHSFLNHRHFSSI